MTFRIPTLEGPGHEARLRRIQARFAAAEPLASHAVRRRRISRARLVVSWLVGLALGAALGELAIRIIA